MCFSEFASFTASALLIPTGLYCIKVASTKNAAYIPFACVPLAFGIQQGAEGFVWTGLQVNNSTIIYVGSSVFLFFSHWLWLVWIPWTALNLEQNQTIQQICRFLTVVGSLYGAVLFLPLLIHDGWLSATMRHSSIEYQAQFIGDFIPIAYSRLLYMLIILTPLLISSNQQVKVFGGLVTLATGISYLAFNYAFVSVWCFFAALLSFYIVYVILKADIPSNALKSPKS